ncbi:putative porin [Ideonella livida]|uniref:TonB-dependent receptor n=1 Tax=Ideonella livida TaxID=2707176 RepID=A0A7C9PJR1_9BURK|nr:putative porin [Ideonella livida]NDY93736.1 hypothetical protein [Ideonella livida]
MTPRRLPSSFAVRRPRALALAPTLAACLLSAGSVQAQTPAPAAAPGAVAEAPSGATLQALVEALVRQGLLSRARADEILATPSAPAAEPAGLPVVRVPYLSQTTRQALKEELRAEVMDAARDQGWARPGELPDWARRLRMSGDLRLRAQHDGFDGDNLAPELFRSQTDSPAWAPDLTNTRHDRQRLTLRARLGVEATLAEGWTTGLRLGTGAANASPTASSQNLGNQMGRATVSLDRGWIRWQAQDELSRHRLEGGRLEVPFERSDLVWPDDLALDGVAWRYERLLSAPLSAFATAGVFPLEEQVATARDKTLLGLQAGAIWSPSPQWQLRGALALYDFRHMEGVRESTLAPTDALAGTTAYQASAYPAAVRQKGNTLINLNAPGSTAAPVWGLASRFRPVDLQLALRSLHLPGREASLGLNVVRNTGFDLADIQRRAATAEVAGLEKKTLAWQLRAAVGPQQAPQTGDWSAFIAWRHVERDAWIDAYTDTTWHLGGTNYRGVSAGAQTWLAPRVTLGARFTSTRNLDDGVRFLAIPGDASSLSGNLSSAPLRIDVLQADLTVRF